MKKKLTALALVIVMVAMLFTGLTMAYFTDTDEATNTFTVGSVEIKLDEAPVDPETGKEISGDRVQENQYNTIVPGIEYDKDPIVHNTGKSDAYVRAKVTITEGVSFLPGVNVAAGGTDDYSDSLYIDAFMALINNTLGEGWEIVSHDDIFDSILNGKADITFVIEYSKVLEKGKDTTPVFETIGLPAQFGSNDYMPEEFKVTVVAEAIQADGLTQAEAMAILDNAGDPLTAVEATVSSDAELKTALTSDAAKIVVDLTSDVTYDVAAWQNDAMGGENTKVIIINGNGKTITFNHTNSDWNNIVTNGATLVIKDAKLTNAGYNNGPWNRHDLNFACDVEMENVTSDKAFAFKAGASLKNVTINDANTSDTYAIWIQPNGQTVTLEGCTIDMLACTGGRGIKIDEQYVGSPAKVTLVVKDTTFKTEEKSAILVKSVAGADITVDNIDITGVAADSTNAVWVDEASKAYADLVTVTGASKIVEK